MIQLQGEDCMELSRILFDSSETRLVVAPNVLYEMKSMQHILLLAINNVAFFVIAGLSGYLSEQLFRTDEELQILWQKANLFEKSCVFSQPFFQRNVTKQNSCTKST